MAYQSRACPSSDVLAQFIGEVLNAADKESIETHLGGCATCRNLVLRMSDETAPGEASESTGDFRASAFPNSVFDVPAELRNHNVYRIDRELGRGGMGVVYLGFDRIMERPVVVKVINQELLRHSGAAERFLREIRSAARLHHPNVMTTYAAIQEGGFLAFAMEYVPGENLHECARRWSAKGQAMPVANACHYIRQAALGLQHVHEQGMIHRDIKPSNLMLKRDGTKHTVKILDFGLAKSREASGVELSLVETTDDPGRTGAGRMLGTPDYMAPEQARDAAAVDIRADVYSLGCSLSFLLTGKPPFKGRDLRELLLAHAATPAAHVSQLRPETPKALDEIVAKAMEKRPADRYQTPAEFAKALWPFLKLGDGEKAVSSTAEAKRAAASPIPKTPSGSRGGLKPLKPESFATPVQQFDSLVLGESLSTASSTGLRKSVPSGHGRRAVRWGVISFALVSIGVVAWKSLNPSKPKDTIARLDAKNEAKLPGNDAESNSASGRLEKKPTKVESPSKERVTVVWQGAKAGLADRSSAEKAGERAWIGLGDELRQTNDVDFRKIVWGGPAWSDFDIEFEARKLSGEGMGFRTVFRWASPQVYASVFLGHDGMIQPEGGVDYKKHPSGSKSLKVAGPVKNANDWNRYKISVRGPNVKVWANGRQCLDYFVSRTAAGGFGFETNRSSVAFRNIVIKNPEGKTLWEWLPQASAPKPVATSAIGKAEMTDGGKWVRVGDELHQLDDSTMTKRIYWGDPAWTDLDFEFEARYLKEHDFGCFYAFVRSPNSKDLWLLLLGNSKVSLLAAEVNGQWDPLRRVPKAGLPAAKPDDWMRVRISLRGENIVATFNDQEAFNHQIGRPANGRVGLGARKAAVAFRKIKVTDPRGKVLWEGLPEID